MTETPSFLNSMYTSNSIDLGSMAGLWNGGTSTTAVPYGGWHPPEEPDYTNLEKYKATLVEAVKHDINYGVKKKMAETYKYRIVQVFIVDTNSSLPADKAILYRGEQRFTDATDQELFFELDIKGMLEKHNEMRVTYKDKKLSKADHEVKLEPARVRDLTMNIVDVVRF